MFIPLDFRHHIQEISLGLCVVALLDLPKLPEDVDIFDPGPRHEPHQRIDARGSCWSRSEINAYPWSILILLSRASCVSLCGSGSSEIGILASAKKQISLRYSVAEGYVRSKYSNGISHVVMTNVGFVE